MSVIEGRLDWRMMGLCDWTLQQMRNKCSIPRHAKWYFISFNVHQLIGSSVDWMLMGLSVWTDQSGRSCLSLMHHCTGIWVQPYLSQTISSVRILFTDFLSFSPAFLVNKALQKQVKILPSRSWYRNTTFWNVGYAEQY